MSGFPVSSRRVIVCGRMFDVEVGVSEVTDGSVSGGLLCVGEDSSGLQEYRDRELQLNLGLVGPRR